MKNKMKIQPLIKKKVIHSAKAFITMTENFVFFGNTFQFCTTT